MSEWTIYLWTRLDSFSFTFGLICWVLLIGLCISTTINALERRDGGGANWGIFIKLWLLFVLMAFLSCLIPTTKEFAMINVIPKLANSEISQQVQKDMPEIYTMAKDALKEMIKPTEKKS